MESGSNMDKKTLETTNFTETTKLASRDLKLKKVMTVSFFIQWIRVLNKHQYVHMVTFKNNYKDKNLLL